MSFQVIHFKNSQLYRSGTIFEHGRRPRCGLVCINLYLVRQNRRLGFSIQQNDCFCNFTAIFRNITNPRPDDVTAELYKQHKRTSDAKLSLIFNVAFRGETSRLFFKRRILRLVPKGGKAGNATAF